MMMKMMIKERTTILKITHKFCKNNHLIVIIIKKNSINTNQYTVIFSEFYMMLLILKTTISFKNMNNKILPTHLQIFFQIIY